MEKTQTPLKNLHIAFDICKNRHIDFNSTTHFIKMLKIKENAQLLAKKKKPNSVKLFISKKTKPKPAHNI